MYGTVPTKEITSRIDAFQVKLRAGGFDGALIIQATDLFYFTGTAQQGCLYVPANGEPILMVRKYYPRAQNESPLRNIIPFKALRDIPPIILNQTGLPKQNLLMELDVVPAALLSSYQKQFESSTIIDGSHIIRALRAIKSPWEISWIQRAGELVASALAMVPQLLEPGMRELDLAAVVEYQMRKNGHQGVVRMRAFNGEIAYGVIVSGASGAVRSSFDGPIAGIGLSPYSPKGPSFQVIRDDSPIIVDLVGACGGYACDVTRTFCPSALKPEHRDALKVCMAIQDTLVKEFKPGVSCSVLYNRAVSMAKEAGYSEYFMGPMDDQAGFVAHGVGLEIDEWPILAPRFPGELEEGHVLAFEPKIILPTGAVGIENTWVVTPEGGKPLCPAPNDYCRCC